MTDREVQIAIGKWQYEHDRAKSCEACGLTDMAREHVNNAITISSLLHDLGYSVSGGKLK